MAQSMITVFFSQRDSYCEIRPSVLELPNYSKPGAVASRSGVLHIDLPHTLVTFQTLSVHHCCDLIEALTKLRDMLAQAEVDEVLGDQAEVER